MSRPQRATPCRHFNGIQNKTCRAGIAYDDISRKSELGDWGCALRLPCIHAVENEYPCPKLDRFTDKELRAQDDAVHRMIADHEMAREAIMKAIEARGELKHNVHGSITCPVCKVGTLSYRRAGGYNGHVHATCSTNDCVRWME